jgi:hypothetical protein
MTMAKLAGYPLCGLYVFRGRLRGFNMAALDVESTAFRALRYLGRVRT